MFNDVAFSGYRALWLFVMFDLPVDDKEARRRYARFRKKLLAQGFAMLQFSVYARHCPSEDASSTHRKVVREHVPPGGRVRIMGVTDAQFGKMEIYRGKTRECPEEAPRQLALF